MYWMHPSIPWLQLFPRHVTSLRQFGYVPVWFLAVEKENCFSDEYLMLCWLCYLQDVPKASWFLYCGDVQLRNCSFSYASRILIISYCFSSFVAVVLYSPSEMPVSWLPVCDSKSSQWRHCYFVNMLVHIFCFSWMQMNLLYWIYCI